MCCCAACCLRKQRKQHEHLTQRRDIRVVRSLRLRFWSSSGSVHQAPPCPPSLGGRSPGESAKRAARATKRCAKHDTPDNLRTSTWIARRNPLLRRPSDRAPTHSGVLRSAGIGTHGPDQPPPARAHSSPPPFRCRRAAHFWSAL